MTERKLDIFRTLKHADIKDVEFFNRLTDDEKKALQPFLVTRWLSGTSVARQVIFINELVNPYVFVNHIQRDHKGLLWLLTTIVTGGTPQKYVWNKLPSKSHTHKPLSVNAIAEYYGMSIRDATHAVECLSGNDILDIVDELGWQSETVAKVRKEHKDADLRKDPISKSRRNKQEDTQSELLEF